MKILVTGGAGYIGSHTCVELSRSGYIPVIVDNFNNSKEYIVDRIRELSTGEIILHKGDCTDKAFMEGVFESEKSIGGIIHFAAHKAVGESNLKPLKYYHNNIESTLVVLELMDKYGIDNFVFSSSCTVYGEPDELPVTEKSPTKKAESPYGRTKQICEEILRDYFQSGKSIKIASLRYFNPIGAHPSGLIGELPLGIPNNLVPFITQTAIGKRQLLTIFGDDYNTPDGTCIRDYIHVVDLAQAHVQTMDHLVSKSEDAAFLVLNLGMGQGKSVREVVHSFEEVSGVSVNYKVGPRRPGDVEKVYADVTKARETLGWEAQLSLKQALRDAWNWEKAINQK